MIFNLSRDRLAHAYILEGDNAETRKQALHKLVKSILCERPGMDGEPCGSCPSCRKIDGRTHEDVSYMEMSGKTGYKVSDASAWIGRLAMSSYGSRNVGVIEDANLLKEEVQNKLLKTLEEPYPGTVIILETPNRATFLDTVRSRCVLLRMDEIDDNSEDSEIPRIRRVYFYKFRKEIDKHIKSQEDALNYLDALEREAHTRMLDGDAMEVNTIIRIEDARRDIIRGMGYKQGLKKLYLELNSVKERR